MSRVRLSLALVFSALFALCCTAGLFALGGRNDIDAAVWGLAAVLTFRAVRSWLPGKTHSG